MKKVTKVLLSTALLLGATLPVLPSITDAHQHDGKKVHTQATYWSGWVKLAGGKTFETRKFNLSDKKIVLDFQKYATGKDASFSIELKDAKGKTIDSCVGDAYVNKAGKKAKCYFDVKRKAGKYSLKFTNHTKGSVLEIPKYVLKDQ